jgi:hypothetical protein
MADGGIAALPTFDADGQLLAVIEAPRGSVQCIDTGCRSMRDVGISPAPSPHRP